MQTIEYIDTKGKRVFGELVLISKDKLTAYVRRSGEKKNIPIHYDHIVESYRKALEAQDV